MARITLSAADMGALESAYRIVREIDKAQRQAHALVAALRDAANYANANPCESFPGVGDLDDLTDKADALSALLDGLTA